MITAALAVASLAPTLTASAQTPEPPGDPVAPITEEQGNEIVHSWALAPAGSDEDGGVGNRPDLSYVADPGSIIDDAVTLYNLSNVPLTFRVYATDAFNDPNGEFSLLGADEVPVDVGTWVGVGGEEVPVPARTQVTIPIRITIPENATPGDHVGAVLASNAATSSGGEGQELTLDRRTGTRLYVRVNGPLVPELAIADVKTDYQASLNPLAGSATVTYRIENRGNVRLGGTVNAAVGGPFGLGKQEGTEQTIDDLLPGQSVTIEQRFEDVPAFLVAVTEVTLDPTADGEIAVESSTRNSITFAPPILLLLGLLALLFGLLAVRAYRRHRDRTDPLGESPGEPALDAEREPEHQPT